MAKFLVGVLTTRDAEKAKRCIDSIGYKDVDIVVFVNSPDRDYLKKVEETCAGYTVIETECNGTPGKGKNTVLDYFIQNRYDYLLPIDGDDFYTKGAVKQIVRYVKVLEDVDVLGQLENKMSYQGKETVWKEFSKNMASGTFAAKSRANWRTIRQFNRLTDDVFPFNRILVLSQYAAKNFRYNEEILVADDLLANFVLYANANLKYYLLQNRNWYYYDLTDGGVLQTFATNESNSDNIKPFFDKIKELDFSLSKATIVE